MKVGELITALQAADPDLIVWTQGDDEWQHYAQTIEVDDDRLVLSAEPPGRPPREQANEAIAKVLRRRAILDIIAASELVGAHGLHLTMREVEQMPDDVLRALHVLGVTDAEITAADTGED